MVQFNIKCGDDIECGGFFFLLIVSVLFVVASECGDNPVHYRLQDLHHSGDDH